jgi:hypothetical protein
MAESTQAPVTNSARMSAAKVKIIKTVLLTVIGLGLGFTHHWASARYYRADYVAGIPAGFIEGAVMPAALPGLLMGYDLPIYAPNNVGRPYKIGFILGLNISGTIFFGVAFWEPRRRKKYD